MTTHDYQTDGRYAPEGVQPPNAQAGQLREPAVPSTSEADPSGQHSEAVAAPREWSPDATADQPAPPAAHYDPPVDPNESAAPGSHAGRPETGVVTGSTESPTTRTLFADDELAGLRARWDNVQAGFVDDPKDCVHKADGLVSDVVDQLTTGFTQARSRLEEHWSRGEEASTEDLRLALKGYREFFERLLAV
jgi:hypothetical protein